MLDKLLGEMADKVFISSSTVAASSVRHSWRKHNPPTTEFHPGYMWVPLGVAAFYLVAALFTKPFVACKSECGVRLCGYSET